MGLLDTLYRDCTGFLDLRALRKGKPTQQFLELSDLAGIKGFLVWNRDADLYFGVATRNGAGGKKEHIVNIPALWIDIDFKSVGQEKALEGLDAFPLKPTFRVASGGGLHCYWKLKEPAEQDDIELCESIMRSLAMRLDGDMACCDASRILRIPNTQNHKYKPPRPVHLIYENGSEYSLLDFEPFVMAGDVPQAAPLPSARDSSGLDAIMACQFMQHCRENASCLPEPLWYAMISEIIREPGGPALAHQLSKPYAKYKAGEVDKKILHALNSSGPYTCEKIRQLGHDCGLQCEVKSPAGLSRKAKRATAVEEDGFDRECVTSTTNATSTTNSHEHYNQSQTSHNRVTSESQTPKGAPQDDPRVEQPQVSVTPTEMVRMWVESVDGIFTLDDVARDLQIVSVKNKALLRQTIQRLNKQNIIERVGAKRGTYRKREEPVEELKWWESSGTEYDISLPFALSSKCIIYPKNIIVVSGEKNSAKTAFALCVAYFNRDRHQVEYFTSEMAGDELRDRIKKTGLPVDEWRKIKFYDKAENFQDHIKPDGLNIVDFLEIHDEFWKVGGTIRAIYDRLTTGIAIICMQKKQNTDTGKGGEVTLEKARLAISLSTMFRPDGKIFNRAKLVKVKAPRNTDGADNPQGMVLDFNVYGGWEMIATGNWYRLQENPKERSRQ